MKVINNDYTKKVQYLGVEFSIPENHNHIATDSDGAIYSYYAIPECTDGDWYNDDGSYCRIGTAEIRRSESSSSLESYI